MSNPLPPLEAAWQTLRSNLEWAQEFGLVFVFCSDIRAKQALFDRANDLMQTQVRPFQRPEVREAPNILQQLLPLAINPASVHAQSGMPLWLDLDGHPGDATWDQARRDFLHRLNERRAALTREHSRTVILVLPLDWTKHAAEAAPDLWTIRQPSVYLDTQNAAQNPSTSDAPAISTALHGQSVAVPSRELPAAVLRWQAAQKEGQTPLSTWSATQALEAALESGHIELAWQIAQESVAQIQAQISGLGKTPERLRDLSVSMDKLGDVAQALGRLDEAQQAYCEVEKLHRNLINDFGQTPERLRDLSVSMNKLGIVAQALGRLDRAQQAYREAQKLRRTLIEDFGQTTERLRDLAVSISKQGEIAQALGRLDEAQEAYREGEKLFRALIEDFGKTPERLRDLAVSINKRGEIARALGRLDEAQKLYREGEKLFRTLVQDFGQTPARLRDLSVSMNTLGNVAQVLGRPDEAQQAYREAEKLCRALIDDFGPTPERLRDLSIAMEKLGEEAQAMGRLDEAQQAFEAEITTAKDLIERYGEMRLGQTLVRLGETDQAQTHLAHAALLYQRLAIALPHEPRYRAAMKELEA